MGMLLLRVEVVWCKVYRSFLTKRKEGIGEPTRLRCVGNDDDLLGDFAS